MAHCPPGYTHDDYGNCVYSPVDYTQDPTFTGTGEGEALDQIEQYFDDKGLDWGEYESYFDDYTGSDWETKEKLLRDFAGIDIGQIGTTWDLRRSQLGTGWLGDIEAGGDFIGQKAYYENMIGEAGSMWGLMSGEYDPLTGLGGDIGRREWETFGDWQFTQSELNRLRGEAGIGWATKKGGFEDAWKYGKEQIGLGTRGGLLQTGAAQDVALNSIGFATAGTSAFDRMQREIREGYTREVEEGERKLGYATALGEYELGTTYAGLGYDPETGEWGGGQYGAGKRSYDTAMAGLNFERTMGQEKYDAEIDRLQYLIDTGQITYEDAVASGNLMAGMNVTDIGQALEMNIWETQQGWRDEQEAMLRTLMGQGIFSKCSDGSEPVNGVCPDGNPPITTCDDEAALNTGEEGPCQYLDSLDDLCPDGSMPPCEVICPDGTPVTDTSQCEGHDPNNDCWYDNTGNLQCQDFGFGDLGLDIDLDLGFDLDFGFGLDQSSCADQGGTWNDDTGSCEGATWNIFTPDENAYDNAMNSYCTSNDPNSYWDGSQCVEGEGEYEAQDWNQTFDADFCSQQGGSGFSDVGGSGLNACMNQESVGDFAACINNGGSAAECSPLLMVLSASNVWVGMGIDITAQNYTDMINWVESGTAEETFVDLTDLDTDVTTTSDVSDWKQFFSWTGLCIPSKALIDTPDGSKIIDNIRAGDYVIGYSGKSVRVQQKIEYSEKPNSQYYTLTFDDDSTVSLSINHRIEDVRINDYKVGNVINGKTITSINTYNNVTTSYDLLTDDRGYQISGAPVNSMVLDKSIALGDFRKDEDLKALLISGGYVEG